jgi:hypothetical protein
MLLTLPFVIVRPAEKQLTVISISPTKVNDTVIILINKDVFNYLAVPF